MNNLSTLKGKDLILATLHHQDTTSVPWVPFAGIHAGKLLGYTGREILTDEGKLFDSLIRVNQVYEPDGQPVLFDLQIEAEILGCKLLWSDFNPPTVASHPLAETTIIPTHIPEPTEGRLPVALNVMRKMKKSVGEHTALFGLVTGPFTLASHLRGTDIFLDSIDRPEYLISLLEYTVKVCKQVAEFYMDAGMDVIALVDPLVSQVSPRHFKRFLLQPFAEIFHAIQAGGACSSFFVCGDATKNIEAMCQTLPDCIAVDENIDMVKAKEITDRYNIVLSGNIPLTSRMLFGTQQDNMQYVVDLLDKLSHHNLILSPGCDMPYDIPIENTIGAMRAVRDTEGTRKLLEGYQAQEITAEVELPDYEHLPRPLIEVFTLDSDTCAACSYMFGAAKRVVTIYEGNVDLVEYKITRPENLARIKKMGVKNLPSIYINGVLKYSSIIPNQREFLAEIDRVMKWPGKD